MKNVDYEMGISWAYWLHTPRKEGNEDKKWWDNQCPEQWEGY